MPRGSRFLVSFAISFFTAFLWSSYGQSQPTRLGEFAIGAAAEGDQDDFCGATDGSGNSIVVWTGSDGSGTGVYVARLDATGRVLSSPRLVNEAPPEQAGDQNSARVAALPDGRFIVAWASFGQDAPGSWGIFARRFDANGTAIGGKAFQVNLSSAGDQVQPDVGLSGDGTAHFVWFEGDSINGRAFPMTGNPSAVGTHTDGIKSTSTPYPTIAVAPDGSHAVAWGDKSIGLRMYGRGGTPIVQTVADTTSGEHSRPQVGYEPDGHVAVVWQFSNGHQTDIYGRRFDDDGNAVDPTDAVMNADLQGNETAPCIGFDADGTAVAVWTSDRIDDKGLGVAYRRSFAGRPIDLVDRNANLAGSVGDQSTSGSRCAVVDPWGNFLILWKGPKGNGTAIFAEKFFVEGLPSLAEFRVNSIRSGNQTQPAVALNAAGKAVVIWRTPAAVSGKFRLVGQLYDALGDRTGGEFLVTTLAPAKAEFPTVAMADDGSFVVAWTGADSVGTDGTVLSDGVFARRFAANGVPGPIKAVNDFQNDAQGAASIAMNGLGAHVIAWHSRDASAGGDTSGYGIFAKRYDAAGNQIGTEFLVNKGTAGSQIRPSAAMAPNGGFVIAWTTLLTEPDGDIFLRRYNVNGVADPNDTPVNSFTTGVQGAPSVGVDSVGNFTVVWTSNGQDGSGAGIYGRRFLANGSPRSEPFSSNPVNANTAGDQSAPYVAVAPGGAFVAAYTSVGEDGGGPDSEGIFARRFDANAAPLINGPPLQVNQFVEGKQSFLDNDAVPGNRKIAMDGTGGYMIVWTSGVQDGSGMGIYATRVLTNSKPAVVTGPAIEITSGSARLTGTVNPNGVAAAAAFQYGLTTDYSETVLITPAIPAGTSAVPVNRVIGNLVPNETYHYRLTAQNSLGAGSGDDATFTTAAAPPIVTTDGATNVTNSGATIIGTINPNGSEVTEAVVEFGLTTSYGTSVTITPLPGSERSPVAVSRELLGLGANQTYHFRVTATNSAGTANGADGTFTTGATAPTTVTGGTTAVSSAGATLLGTVTPNGSATSASFEYGLTTEYGSSAPVAVNPGSGLAPVDVSATISGLIPNRTYHYRLTASNDGGLSAGQDATFNTPAQLPLVTTDAETDVTPTSAGLHGTVNPKGTETTAYFVFRKVGSFVQQQTSAADLGSGTSDLALEFDLTDLEPYTDYEYRVVASNGAGTIEGAYKAFKTPVEALLTQPDAFFAQLGGSEILLDVLGNDGGTGLRITNVSGEGISIAGDSQSLVLTPSSVSDLPAILTYRVTDAAGNESADTNVTVSYFSALQGTYYNGKTTQTGTVFLVRLDVDFAGVATGRLEWENEQYPFKVNLDERGRARVERARPEESQATLITDFQADLSSAVPAVVCAFKDLKPTPQEEIDLGLNYSPPAAASAVPDKGLQVIFIDPGEEEDAVVAASAPGARGVTASTEIPGGIGFTLLRVGKKGTARFVTKMPDFGAFSAKTVLIPGTGQLLPRYQLRKSYKKSGFSGSVEGFTFPGPSDIPGLQRTHGTLSWSRFFSTRGGAANLIAAFDGFGFKAGLNGVPYGFESGKCTVRLARGGLIEPIEFPGTIRNGKVTVDTQDPAILGLGVSLKFKLTGGTFNGSFTMKTDFSDVAADEKVKMIGGVAGDVGFLPFGLDKRNPRARGSFRVKSTGRTGRVEITPR